MELGTEWKNWGSEILKRGRPDGLEETAGGNAEARGAEGSQGPERTRPSHTCRQGEDGGRKVDVRGVASEGRESTEDRTTGGKASSLCSDRDLP